MSLARARRGLEIAISSSPGTCTLGCLTVNIESVFDQRGYSNVIFACRDCVLRPFAPATYFVAVMCEPTGHEFERTRDCSTPRG